MHQKSTILLPKMTILIIILVAKLLPLLLLLLVDILGVVEVPLLILLKLILKYRNRLILLWLILKRVVLILLVELLLVLLIKLPILSIPPISKLSTTISYLILLLLETTWLTCSLWYHPLASPISSWEVPTIFILISRCRHYLLLRVLLISLRTVTTEMAEVLG